MQFKLHTIVQSRKNLRNLVYVEETRADWTFSGLRLQNGSERVYVRPEEWKAAEGLTVGKFGNAKTEEQVVSLKWIAKGLLDVDFSFTCPILNCDMIVFCPSGFEMTQHDEEWEPVRCAWKNKISVLAVWRDGRVTVCLKNDLDGIELKGG